MFIHTQSLQRLPLPSVLFTAIFLCFTIGCSDRSIEPTTRINQQKVPPSSAVANIDDHLTASIEDPLDDNTGHFVALQRDNTSNVNARTVRANFTNLLNKQVVTREVFYLNGVENNYVEFTYTAGKLVKRAWYTGAGADAIWFNADDVISAYTDFAPTTKSINSIRYTGPGNDTEWFTADDLVEHYDADLLDAAGAVVGEATYTLAGIDSTWFTADDLLSSLEVKGVTAQGNRTRVHYTTAGADADWTTLADNVTLDFRIVELNATAQPVRTITFRGVGADGEVFTADDVVAVYRDYTYDAQNEISQSILYGGGPNVNGAGADGKWFTADDLIRNCRQLERDAAGLPYRTVTTRPGVDVSCFTTDDVIRGYHQDEFDAAGVVTRSVSYHMPGIDAAWFTADDVIDSEALFAAP